MDDLQPEVLGHMKAVGLFSISGIQRKFKIGYARAMRIADALEKKGIIKRKHSTAAWVICDQPKDAADTAVEDNKAK